jgi:sRNA-binding protein
MSDYSQEGAGKISLHGNGMGVASPEEVEKRAREIAMINERNPEEFTQADWAQARKELLGAEHPTPEEETKESAALTDDWYIAAPSRGHRVPRPGVDEEEETVGEHLVTGGVEEATHDQMLEARREELEQEGGIT